MRLPFNIRSREIQGNFDAIMKVLGRLAGEGQLAFPDSVAATSVPKNTLFRDTADGKLKFKDNAGAVHAFY